MKARVSKFGEPIMVRLGMEDTNRLERLTGGIAGAKSETVRRALRVGLDRLESEMRERWAGDRPEQRLAL